MHGDGPEGGTGRYLISSDTRGEQLCHALAMVVTRDSKIQKVAIYNSTTKYVQNVKGGSDIVFSKSKFLLESCYISF